MSRYFGWKRYVPVAERRAKARRRASQLARQGVKLRPVHVQGRTIAKTFWGKAWCTNLEAYSDYSNRLPRGRTYARNGSVVDLGIRKGQIDAMVSGSEIYDVTVHIDTLSETRWQAVRQRCAGQIDSLVELLQGKVSEGVMEIVTDPAGGLFPTPRQIHMQCSCPDWATMCKHVAAVLYGVGNRLDSDPALLFSLRGVDPGEMIAEAIDHGVSQRRPARGRVLADDDLSSVFGIDLDMGDGLGDETLDAEPPPAPRRRGSSKTPPSTVDAGPAAAPATLPRSHTSHGKQLSPTALHVLAMVTDEPGSGKTRIAEWLGLTRPQADSAIKQLRGRDLVTFVGAPRTGGYHRTTTSTVHSGDPIATLSSPALQVLAVISDEPGMRTPQLAEWLGLSRAQIGGAITQLRDRHLIEFVGARRTGGYERAAPHDH